MTTMTDVTTRLVSALDEYGDDVPLQVILDGVRDLVSCILLTEDITPESFFEAVRQRMVDVDAAARMLASSPESQAAAWNWSDEEQ
jgi:hypothetical protein